MFHTKNLFYQKSYFINRFLYKKYIYCVSCFIRSHDDNVNQMSQVTRDHMLKCDKSNNSSNNGSVKNNYQMILKESY